MTTHHSKKITKSACRHSSVRFFALVLSFSFGAQQAVLAAPMTAPQAQAVSLSVPMPAMSFRLPESVATIEDGYAAPKPAKTIFLLQDAHTNESGQMNAAKALEQILPSEKISYVFTEGASNDVSLSFLKQYFPQDALREASVSFVRKGILKGGEYANLNGEHPFTLWGVEDPALYKKALSKFVDVMRRRAEAGAYLDHIARSAGILKEEIYNSNLKDIDAAAGKHRSGEMSLTDYFSALKKAARKAGVSLAVYPHLSALNDLKKTESRIDFARVAKEQDAAIRSLPVEDQRSLSEVSKTRHSPFRMGGEDKAAERAFYALLAEKLDAAGQTKSFPELAEYFSYLTEAHKLNARETLNEMADFEADVFGALAKSNDEKLLYRLSKNLITLQNFLDMKLAPQDFENYKADVEAFNVRLIGGFFNKKIQEIDRHYDRAVLIEERYEEVMKSAVEFYELALERDEAFIRNMTEKMDREGIAKAVLVTGGYHASNLKRLFQERGISYVTILPQILHETDSKRYEKMVHRQFASARKETRYAARAGGNTTASTLMLGDVRNSEYLAPLVTTAAGLASQDAGYTQDYESKIHQALNLAQESVIGARLAAGDDDALPRWVTFIEDAIRDVNHRRAQNVYAIYWDQMSPDQRHDYSSRIEAIKPYAVRMVQEADETTAVTKYFRLKLSADGRLWIDLNKQGVRNPFVFNNGPIRSDVKEVSAMERLLYLRALGLKIAKFEAFDDRKADPAKKSIKFDADGELVRKNSEPAFTLLRIIQDPNYEIGGAIADGARLAVATTNMDSKEELETLQTFLTQLRSEKERPHSGKFPRVAFVSDQHGTIDKFDALILDTITDALIRDLERVLAADSSLDKSFQDALEALHDLRLFLDKKHVNTLNSIHGFLEDMVVTPDERGFLESEIRQLRSAFENGELKLQFKLDPDKALNNQLSKHGVNLTQLQGRVFFHNLGDLMDRGKYGVKVFRRSAELIEAGLSDFVLGNHDLWEMMNLWGFHLPWYRGFNFYGYSDEFDARTDASGRPYGNVKDILARYHNDDSDESRDTHTTSWWAQRLAAYNEHQAKAQKEKWAKLDEVVNGQIDPANPKKRVQGTGLFFLASATMTEEQVALWGQFRGVNTKAKIDIFTGVRAVGSMSLEWWKDLSNKFKAEYAKIDPSGKSASPAHKAWREAIVLMDTQIIPDLRQDIQSQLSQGNWWWRIFEAINSQNYTSPEWWAKDWVSHKDWGTAVLDELNEGIDPSSPLYVTQANYLDNPVLLDIARFYRRNFNLYTRDIYQNVGTHAWLPVNENGEFYFVYNGVEYRGKGDVETPSVWKGLSVISRDVKNSGDDLSVIYEALALVNGWYADNTTRAKVPDVAAAINEHGVEKIADMNGFRRLFMGHLPFHEFNKLTPEKRGEIVNFRTGEQGRIIFTDHGMGKRFGYRGAVVRVGTELTLRAYEHEGSGAIIRDPRTAETTKSLDGQTVEVPIFNNPGITREVFLDRLIGDVEARIDDLQNQIPSFALTGARLALVLGAGVGDSIRFGDSIRLTVTEIYADDSVRVAFNSGGLATTITRKHTFELAIDGLPVSIRLSESSRARLPKIAIEAPRELNIRLEKAKKDEAGARLVRSSDPLRVEPARNLSVEDRNLLRAFAFRLSEAQQSEKALEYPYLLDKGLALVKSSVREGRLTLEVNDEAPLAWDYDETKDWVKREGAQHDRDAELLAAGVKEFEEDLAEGLAAITQSQVREMHYRVPKISSLFEGRVKPAEKMLQTQLLVESALLASKVSAAQNRKMVFYFGPDDDDETGVEINAYLQKMARLHGASVKLEAPPTDRLVTNWYIQDEGNVDGDVNIRLKPMKSGMIARWMKAIALGLVAVEGTVPTPDADPEVLLTDYAKSGQISDEAYRRISKAIRNGESLSPGELLEKLKGRAAFSVEETLRTLFVPVGELVRQMQQMIREVATKA